jgi:hypothetical protein
MPELLSHPDVYTIYMINSRHTKMGKKEVRKERPKEGGNNA